ncbi:hypothetical protein BN8_03435 [Fibrisoma limi BUZ 3]|uniref:Uncharacterized protein n=1 Tax=Fibrisoma limi BUZ 3 TaxID=1185876 RepID=I2GK53_9BACT|nr:hypothetical protein [Fibrisoma limi]CCH54278.1 hypothetical protein BN8_03435 [Fibrisoma limi BUZ 3]
MTINAIGTFTGELRLFRLTYSSAFGCKTVKVTRNCIIGSGEDRIRLLRN